MTFPQNLILKITNQESFNSRPLMDPESKRKWVEALRSGEFKQGERALYYPGEDTCCCLGVKAKIDGHTMVGAGLFEIGGMNYFTTLPFNYEKGLVNGNGEFVGFLLIMNSHQDAHSLVGLNDSGYSFSTIAEVIEKLF